MFSEGEEGDGGDQKSDQDAAYNPDEGWDAFFDNGRRRGRFGCLLAESERGRGAGGFHELGVAATASGWGERRGRIGRWGWWRG